MNHRQRFEAVLRRTRPDRVPMVSRLDIWYAANKSANTLPRFVRDMSIEQIEDRLGMGRSARFRDFFRERRDGVTEHVDVDGNQIVTTVAVEGRTLRQIETRDEIHRRSGMRGQVVEHYLKSEEDYRAMTAVWERTTLVADHNACAQFDRDTGAAGLPLLILGLTPVHKIMLEYAGYEQFFYHLHDMPGRVSDLQRVMESRFEAFWPEVARSAMSLVMHGAHWSSQMTPAPLFRRRFLPYVLRFCNAMHEAGKCCAFHGDADLSGLLDEVIESGMDVVDCFACHPLVPLTLSRSQERWGDRVVTWGGFPSTLLEASTSEAEFEAFLDHFIERITSHPFIVGVSDNVMPGAQWPRLETLARLVADAAPLS